MRHHADAWNAAQPTCRSIIDGYLFPRVHEHPAFRLTAPAAPCAAASPAACSARARRRGPRRRSCRYRRPARPPSCRSPPAAPWSWPARRCPRSPRRPRTARGSRCAGRSRWIALNVASTGPSPSAAADFTTPSTSSSSSARGGHLRTGMHVERDEPDALVIAHHLVIDQRHDVLVEHHLLAVGQILEAAERVVQLVVADLRSPACSACRGTRRGRSACPSPGCSSPSRRFPAS